MVVDLHLTDDGDLAISSKGDIAITASDPERIRQQAQMRLATEIGDFMFYPQLGASLQRLVGLPNTEKTGNFGKNLIMRALTYDNFIGKSSPVVDAVPTQADRIEFEVRIPIGQRESILLTLAQLLTL
jgi:hypothetical protein